MAEINDPSQERPSLPRVIDEQVESQRLEAIAREHPEPQALAEAIAEERAPDVADVLEDRPDSAVEVVAELGVDDAAEVLSHMELSLAAGVLEELIDADLIREATDLLEGMEPDDAAVLLWSVHKVTTGSKGKTAEEMEADFCEWQGSEE